MEANLDDWLGEDYVGLCILYYPSILSIIMTNWRWPLSLIILNGYSLQEHLVMHNEGCVPNANEI
jgi:hypothetical protein